MTPRDPAGKPAREELERTLALLEAVARDRNLLNALPDDLRIAFLQAAGRISRPSRLELIRLSRQVRKERRRKAQAEDRDARAATTIREARQASVYRPPPEVPPGEGRRSRGELNKPRDCYVCKAEFRTLHHFYDALCPGCADFNYAKRFQTAPLQGRAAVITGARLKIGYQAALMLLRAGATVVATTRFPHDAARRYAAEPDFARWGGRLRVFGLDLRHSPSVEVFARYLNRSLDRLDLLINNAAQTVRRPPGFYAHLLDFESKPLAELPRELHDVLSEHADCVRALEEASGRAAPSGSADATGLAVWHAGGPGIGLRASASLSQLRYNYDDPEHGLDVFPSGKTDADLQQVDLRAMNSWRLALGDVPTPEMLEVQLVNAVAPFILCGKLKPLMLRRPGRDKHIVNVSAMEGVFSRHTKTDKHPHTNMAKAALNMLTLTSAPDYARDGIHINAVDTGWVTDEDPAVHALRKQAVHDFQPPLDIVDGAARICDPFFSGLRTGEHVWGKFLKDYKPSAW